MLKEHFIITYREDGEIVELETYETEEEMHKRIKCYRQHNIKIIKVLKKVIQVHLVEMKW